MDRLGARGSTADASLRRCWAMLTRAELAETLKSGSMQRRCFFFVLHFFLLFFLALFEFAFIDFRCVRVIFFRRVIGREREDDERSG